ncbi:biotin/lipoyl-containing protein, partial [Daejeonella sp.]|uniref:biotin/lipoyl-containing protein n=1 Tax=Daejeonella sp. TaxID=2805397 RepID=UPI0030C00705
MAEVVKMPKMSDTMTEGVIAKWHKKVGDKVKSGDLMAEVETDKATMDFESYQEGTLLYIGAEEGSAAPVDSVIAVIGAEGEDYKAALEGASSEAPAAKAEEPAKQAEKPEEAEKPAKAPAAKEESTAKVEGAPADDSDPDTAAAAAGATVIRMPLLSDTMTEGVIAEWHKKVGDKVKSDDALADVETDKATMEVIGYAEGTLLYIGVEKGQAAKVNGIIAIVGKEGTDVTPFLKGGTGPEAAAKPAGSSAEATAPEGNAALPAKDEEKQEVQSDSSSRV